MSKEKINRREAMDRVMRLVALAAGLSASELSLLLAEDNEGRPPQKLDRKSIIAQKAANEEIKILKVFVENTLEVFENEFGRVLPVYEKPIEEFLTNIPQDMRGQMVNVCGGHFDTGIFKAGKTGLMFCTGSNTCTGQGIGDSIPGGEPCEGTNNCSGQSCPNLTTCPDNTCDDQDCPKLSICGKNKQTIVTAALLERFKADPYVQLLSQEFNVTTAKALAEQISRRLQDLRRGVVR